MNLWTSIYLLIPGLMLISSAASAQVYTEADSAQNEILAQEQQDGIRFSSRLRPLNQIAGAPAAFYSYFWELGDGSYSTEKEPAHRYSRAGNYPVRLWATNNYDDGKRPPIRIKNVTAGNTTMLASVIAGQNAAPEQDQSLQLRHNADPKPDETFICVLGYRLAGAPIQPEASKGTLLVCYNETHFGKDNFVLEEARTHNAETEIGTEQLDAIINKPALVAADIRPRPGPADNGEVFDQVILRQQLRTMVKETMKSYRNNKVWRVSGSSSLQNIFLQLHTTPDMIRDTNATVKVTAIFIPDNEQLNAELAELQMQIVASHDPNKMQVKHNLLNYRFVNKRRKLRYIIHFQNTGKGPASTIALQTTVPSYLNTATLNVLSHYPACPTCDAVAKGKSCFTWKTTADSIYFTFRNIYLPGTQQKGVNEMDSTKGYVSYELNFGNRTRKRSFSSQTAIFFDKNPPVITNHARNFFKPGLSPGIIAGYYFHNDKWQDNNNTSDHKNWQGGKQLVLGLSIAPYAPHKPYLQAELYLRHQPLQTEQGATIDTSGIIETAGKRYELKDKTTTVSYSSSSADIAGLLKYNLNSWVSVGAGVLLSAQLQQELRTSTVYTVINAPLTSTVPRDLSSSGISALQPSLLLDLGLGRVRVGPSLGFRYLQYFQGPGSRYLLYATWKL